MADHWFRFYNTALDHPKVMMLSDGNFRGWIAILALASKLNGEIPCDFSLLGRVVRKSEQKAKDMMQVFLSAGLIDHTEQGFKPHNWDAKQFKSDSSTERVKRFRKRRGNGKETDQRQRQSTETYKKEESISAAPSALALVDDPVLISFPTNKAGKSYLFLQSHFDQLAPLYPAVDVPQELRGMAAWLISNPQNAKTSSGMPRFINSWLSKTQNRSKPNGHAKISRNDNWLAGAAALAGELKSERE